MVQYSSFFSKNLEMIMGYINNEKQDKKKSPMVSVALKCLFDCLAVNDYLLVENSNTDQVKEELIKLLTR